MDAVREGFTGFQSYNSYQGNPRSCQGGRIRGNKNRVKSNHIVPITTSSNHRLPKQSPLLSAEKNARILHGIELLRVCLEGERRDVGVQLPRVEVPEPLRVLERVLLQHEDADLELVPRLRHACRGVRDRVLSEELLRSSGRGNDVLLRCLQQDGVRNL